MHDVTDALMMIATDHEVRIHMRIVGVSYMYLYVMEFIVERARVLLIFYSL